ncbi:type IV toxin-antitoxin system AbiEi family antitoxin domain-containing protein [Nocardia sp. NPDC050175]|uniref:type IV toxin-antitoxin system AbiEi family antitoxin domain-containing protein n=1 Tax=Nocardia sp. NPDC050175 TaxID=3364317 RepID=UPI00379F4D6D
MRAELGALRDKQFGVFTTAQARIEYTRAELRARLHRGDWVPVFHGVYREATAPEGPELRVEAARLSMGLPILIAAYDTAAELHGFSVTERNATHVLGVQLSRSKHLVVHRDRLDPGQVTSINGVSTTPATRTAIDLARTLNRMDALATLDAASRLGLSPDELSEELTHHHRRRGVRQAAELIDLVDGRAESPMESRTRLQCVDAGLPHPELQLEVPTPDGPRRLDISWPQYRIGLEYDSVAWHSGMHAAARDNTRHNHLATQGWTIFYATAQDVFHRPESFTEPIRQAINRALRTAHPHH